MLDPDVAPPIGIDAYAPLSLRLRKYTNPPAANPTAHRPPITDPAMEPASDGPFPPPPLPGEGDADQVGLGPVRGSRSGRLPMDRTQMARAVDTSWSCWGARRSVEAEA